MSVASQAQAPTPPPPPNGAPPAASPEAQPAPAPTPPAASPEAQPPPAPQPSPPPPAPVAPPPAEAPANFPTMKGHELWIGKDIWLRVGFQAQVWADLLKDSVKQANGDDGAYSRNLFLRRARLYMVSQIYKDVVLFLNIDSPNLGKTVVNSAPASKGFSPMVVQDLTGEWRINDHAFLGAGLIVVPVSRNGLQYTTSYFGLDVANTSVQFNVPTATSGLRDTGFQLRGYALDNKLDYRIGVFQGVRDPGSAATMTAPEVTASQNSFRTAGYVQYNFFDNEKSYLMAYHGHYFGHKKILGVAAGFDRQAINGHKAYFAASGALFGAIPLHGPSKEGGDEVGGVLQYVHYDGQTSIPALVGQNDLLAELAYYNKGINGSVFGKFEMKQVSDDMVKAQNTRWFGGGVKYYLYENVCNLTLAYSRIMFPDANKAATNDSNEFTFQFQFFFL